MKDIIESFIVIPIEIGFSSNFTVSEKLIYGFLITNADNKIFTGTNADISEALSLSKSIVSKSINKLINKNIIDVVFTYNYRHRIRKLYILPL